MVVLLTPKRPVGRRPVSSTYSTNPLVHAIEYSLDVVLILDLLGQDPIIMDGTSFGGR